MNDSIFALFLVALASAMLGLLTPEHSERSPLRLLLGLILSIALLSPIKPLISLLSELRPISDHDDPKGYEEYLLHATEEHINLLRSRLTNTMEKEMGLTVEDLELNIEKNIQGEIVFTECVILTNNRPNEETRTAADRYLGDILECKIVWRISS